jgi:hypothetical protein
LTGFVSGHPEDGRKKSPLRDRTQLNSAPQALDLQRSHPGKAEIKIL